VPSAGENLLHRGRDAGAAVAKKLLYFFTLLRRTLNQVLDHDCLNIAQAAAYSAMVSLFPGLIVVASFVTLLPDAAPLRLQAAQFFDRILPPDVSPLLESYFQTSHRSPKSVQAMLVLIVVSLSGASSVIVTFMEGFRRAFDLAIDEWSFWDRRWRSFALVPISLFPLLIASMLVVFGHLLTEWITAHVVAPLHTPVFVVAFIVRWAVALAGSVGIIGVIYHMGVPPACLGPELEDPDDRRLWGSVRTVRAMSTMDLSWTRTLPGAVLATVLWFVTTLIFGWYVTRFANYSEVYGSLGAGIALLFWLYIISLSVLCGAEFNAQLYAAGPAVLRTVPKLPVPESAAEAPAPESVQRHG
jgi:membrane protein